MSDSVLPPVVAVLLGDNHGLLASLGEAKAAMDDTAKSGSGAFQGLASVGKAALLGLGAAAVGIGVISVKMASDFQASMEKIHTQAQVPQSAIAGLSNSVLNLAGQVGVSADTLAQGLYHVESAFQSTGITSQKAMDILKVAAEGARVGGANLVDVTNALDAAIVAGIPGVQNYQQAMGALNATVGAGDMTMQDLADALGTGVMPVVKNYGLTLTDVGAALATFGDNNIRGAQAGTALRMAVQALAVPVKGGEKALKDMGMSLTQMASDMAKGGLVPALEDLKKHMEAIGLTGQTMNADGSLTSVGEALTQIFGKRAGTGVAVLYDQLDRLQSKYGDITAAAKNFGDAWTQTQATFKQKWAELVQTVEALAIRIGLWLIPKLEDLAVIVSKVVDWFEQHKTVALALGSAIGGVLLVAIGAYIVSMITAAAATVAATWPILAIIVAVGAMAAGVEYAYTHWQWFHDIVQSIWAWIQGTLWPGIRDFASFVGTAFDNPLKAAESAWTGLKNHVSSVWNDTVGLIAPGLHINTFTQSAASTINDAGKALLHTPAIPPVYGPPAPPQLGPPTPPPGFDLASPKNLPYLPTPQVYGPPAPRPFGPPAPPVYGPPAPGMPGAAPGYHVQAPAPQLSEVQQIWGQVYKTISTVVTQIADFVNRETGQIAAWWDSHMQQISTVAKFVWRAVTDIVKVDVALVAADIRFGLAIIEAIWRPAWNILVDLVKLSWAFLTATVKTGMDVILGIIGVVLDLLTAKWGKAWADLKTMFVQLWGDIKAFWVSLWNDLYNIGSNLVSGIVAGVEGAAGSLISSVSNLGGKLLHAVTSFFGISSPSSVMAAQVGGPIVQGIVVGAESAVGALLSWFAGLPGRVLGALGSLGSALFYSGQDLMIGLINGIGSMAGQVAGAIGGVVSGAVRAAANAAGNLASTAVSDLTGGLINFGHNAAGTDNWVGGLTWVGEHGPELVNLPAGSAVYNADRSRQMSTVQPLAGGPGSGSFTGGGSGSVTVTVPVSIDGREVARASARFTLAELLQMQRSMGPLGFKMAG